MQYRIEKKPWFRTIGYKEEVSMLNGENFVRIPKIWSEFPHDRFETLHLAEDGQYPGMFGIIDMGTNADTLTYYIAVSSKKQDLADWMDVVEIPSVTYAIFDTSMKDLQDTTRRIFAQWLPNSGYEHAAAPELEYYPVGDMSNEETYMVEIWVPVEKKA